MAFWLVFLTAFVLALVFTPIAIKIAPKIGAVDIPKDSRRMHTKPVPRFGGLAIFIGTTAALIFTVYIAMPMYQKYFSEAFPGAEFIEQPVPKMTGIIIGGVLIYILGVVDDLKGMPAKVKLLGQLVCGGVAYYFGVRINFVTNHFSVLEDHIFFSGAVSLIFTLIWIAGITNTVNLIDGLDGLAAGISSIASLCLAYTAYIHGAYLTAFAMLALAGGALGFLPYNFH
ncbi:MAG: undecaprenyl/decaprenyl-phosphate alpha-N-acetylglucosaminyl 1-phosphate transferase, partial [Firmicutes bacterium]|nr:undecaprenyl/decaprenyl-phosphate alpha-N-acetylglucosaminyl 1-phosphate transferase [Bacillota bacterium]